METTLRDEITLFKTMRNRSNREYKRIIALLTKQLPRTRKYLLALMSAGVVVTGSIVLQKYWHETVNRDMLSEISEGITDNYRHWKQIQYANCVHREVLKIARELRTPCLINYPEIGEAYQKLNK